MKTWLLLCILLPVCRSQAGATLAGYIPVFRVGESLKVPVVAAPGANGQDAITQALVDLEHALPSNMAFHVITPQAHGSRKPTKAEVTACLILLDMLKPPPPPVDQTEKPSTTTDLSELEATSTPFPLPPRPLPPPPPPPRPPQSIYNLPQTFGSQEGVRPVPHRPHVAETTAKPETHTGKPPKRKKKPDHKDVETTDQIPTSERQLLTSYQLEAIENKAVMYTDVASGRSVYYEYNANPTY